MSLSWWPRTLAKLQSAVSKRRPPRRARPTSYRPHLEWLENRLAPATITVTSTNDDLAVDGTVSLREAIASINAGANINADVATVGTYGTSDTIDFAIPGAGVQTIAPTSALPDITNPVVIDGYTQPGAHPNTLANGEDAVLGIELDGSGLGLDVVGLMITAGQSTVRGLVINRFSDAGIELRGNGGNVLEGNFIGTDVTGTAALRNIRAGVFILGASGNRVGGTTADARNLLSGNNGDGVFIEGTGNLVQGNFIGTDASGTGRLGNEDNGVLLSLASGNTVGGTTAGAGNVLAGNGFFGVNLGGDGNRVEGNFIGTDVTGTEALGNGLAGVGINASDNTIGGTNAGTGNTIAFNSGPGVDVFGGPGNGILGNAIYSNQRLGILLENNGNHQQSSPSLTSAVSTGGTTTIQGRLHSTSRTAFRIEYFSNQVADPSGFGQGQMFLGSGDVTTDAAGNASFTATFAVSVSAREFISATATDANNNTSEFSQDLAIGISPLAVTGIAFCAKEGVPFTNGAVATFTDLVSATAGSFTATINWGDGTPATLGTIIQSGSTFTVLGSHTYAAEDFYNVTVTVTDSSGNSAAETTTVLVGGFVTSLYQDVLNRLPDRPGLDSWVQQLQAGTLSRQQVAVGFLTSPERRGLEVDLYYATFLHRKADADGRQHWLQELMSGVSESQVLVGILTSPEFTAFHPNSTSFVEALYVGVFNRMGSASEVSFWQQRSDSGALTRADVILAFLSSTEAYNDAIDENYLAFLDRRPDPAGQQFWFSLVVSGQLTPTMFSAAILGSDEYLALALTCPPPPT